MVLGIINRTDNQVNRTDLYVANQFRLLKRDLGLSTATRTGRLLRLVCLVETQGPRASSASPKELRHSKYSGIHNGRVNQYEQHSRATNETGASATYTSRDYRKPLGGVLGTVAWLWKATGYCSSGWSAGSYVRLLVSRLACCFKSGGFVMLISYRYTVVSLVLSLGLSQENIISSEHCTPFRW